MIERTACDETEVAMSKETNFPERTCFCWEKGESAFANVKSDLRCCGRSGFQNWAVLHSSVNMTNPDCEAGLAVDPWTARAVHSLLGTDGRMEGQTTGIWQGELVIVISNLLSPAFRLWQLATASAPGKPKFRMVVGT